MSLYILDTDTVTMYRAGNPRVCAHVSAHPPSELAATIITVEEQISGWYTLLRRAKTNPSLVAAYEHLARTVQFFAGVQIVAFTLSAATRFDELRATRIRISTLDLRIGCIALFANAVLVTRNRKDFELIPGLAIEDWST